MAMGYPHEWKLLLVHFLVGGLGHLLFFYILAIYNIFSEGLKPPASFCMCFMRVTSPLGAAPLGDPLLDPLGASASSRSAWDGGATMRRRCGSFNQEKKPGIYRLVGGFWFGTCFCSIYIGNVIIPTDFRGVAQPPTSR